MKKYPLTTQFIKKHSLQMAHYLTQVKENNPILPAIEFFLSLKCVNGFDAKIKELIDRPINDSRSNDGYVQWASLCAEFGAIKLLVRSLNINITGLNQKSPKSKNENSNCDIKAKYKNIDLFFEVKRNSKSETQYIPDNLISALNSISCKYCMIPELINRHYKCDDLNKVIIEITDHINEFEKLKRDGYYTDNMTPDIYSNDNFSILFTEKLDCESDSNFSYLSPPTINDICSYLLCTDRIGKDGRPMESMVVQALNKGADYLICHIPGWDSFEKIVDSCFSKIVLKQGNNFLVDDDRLNQLMGIILFHTYYDFCIINNSKFDNDSFIKIKA